MKLFLTLTLCASLACLYAEDVKEGHSHQGEAFNEGPRQAGPLLGETGEVHLSITTSWDRGQEYFTQGLGQLHGFWYFEAERSFRHILANDPNCAMAYWGLALANWENEKRAKSFISKATELLSQANPHEQLYIKAQANFLDGDPKDFKKRATELIGDLENIIWKYPDDLEVKALLVCRQWQFSRRGVPIVSYEGAEAILQQIFAKQPLHPAHHFRIHLWDKRNAERALDSAACLGKTAPSIAHMWHMPGHIYSKTKRYHDAAWQQQASARIDHAQMARTFILPDQIHNYAHNNEWLGRNFRNLGDAPAAIEMAKSLLSNPRHPKLNTLKGKAHSYRYGRQTLITFLEEFELWDEALALSKTQWLEPLSDSPQFERPRLRLIGLAHYYRGEEEELVNTLAQLESLVADLEKERKEAEEKAREKALKEKKDKEQVDKIVKKSGSSAKKKIKGAKKVVAELNGCLAELKGDLEKAKKSLEESSSPKGPIALRKLSLGLVDEAVKAAEELAENKKKEALPLAYAVEIFHRQERLDDCRSAFEKLRGISSEIDLTAPPFARLGPIAKELGYPSDWRLPHQPAEDILPRPDLDILGPLHWVPRQASVFNLPDQHRKSVSLSDYKGRPVILVFYLGAGCLHCTEQLTKIADHYSEFEKAGLPVLAISTDVVDKLKESQDNYSKGKIPFSMVSDESGETFKAYTAFDDFENEPLHGTFLIDPKGAVLWSDVSADPFMDLDFLLKEFPRLLDLHR